MVPARRALQEGRRHVRSAGRAGRLGRGRAVAGTPRRRRCPWRSTGRTRSWLRAEETASASRSSETASKERRSEVGRARAGAHLGRDLHGSHSLRIDSMAGRACGGMWLTRWSALAPRWRRHSATSWRTGVRVVGYRRAVSSGLVPNGVAVARARRGSGSGGPARSTSRRGREEEEDRVSSLLARGWAEREQNAPLLLTSSSAQ